jgi:predicted deacylase
MSEVCFGNVKAAPGQRVIGVLNVGQLDQIGFARGTIDLPLIVINGAQPGPTVFLVAGTHSGEYEGIESVVRISGEIRPEELSGVLVALPVLNIFGFAAKVPYLCPLDKLNMAGLWPGYSGGTISQRMVYAVWHNIVVKSDYVIDMHGGDFPELQADYAICFQTGDAELDRKSEQMARHFCLPYIRQNPLQEESPTGGLLLQAMEKLRIPGIVSEVGDSGHLDEARLAKDMFGLKNVLKFIGMLPGEPAPPPEGQLKVIDRHSIMSSTHGIRRTGLKIGDEVRKGQQVAEIVDYYGETREKLYSPCDGVVFQIFYQSATNPGNVVMKIGQVGL